MIILPKEQAPTIHALSMPVQEAVWSLVSQVRRKSRTGLVPDGGFSIGFEDGLTAAVPVPHTVIHVVPYRAGEAVVLPQCSEWIADDGVVGKGTVVPVDYRFAAAIPFAWRGTLPNT